jgi:hypothetical protein
MQRTLKFLGSQGDTQVSNQGLVVTRTDIQQARWTDLFTGEETGNAAHMDLSRVQMFFFTLVTLITYGVALGGMFKAPGVQTSGIGAFPELSQGLLALIGISHTGYLASKAMPASQSGPAQPAAEPPAAGNQDQPAVG